MKYVTNESNLSAETGETLQSNQRFYTCQIHRLIVRIYAWLIKNPAVLILMIVNRDWHRVCFEMVT